MTSAFSRFVGCLHAELESLGLDPELAEVDEAGDRIRLPGIRSPDWFFIERAHLDLLGGDEVPLEAAAVFGVYLEDA